MKPTCIVCFASMSEGHECAPERLKHRIEKLEEYMARDHLALVEALDLIRKLRAVIGLLKRGSCWCELGIGNPMVRGHSDACRRAREALDEKAEA